MNSSHMAMNSSRISLAVVAARLLPSSNKKEVSFRPERSRDSGNAQWRNLLFAFVALVTLPAAAHAQSAIVLSAATHNFVAVAEGSTAKYGVHVTNKSGAPFDFSVSLTGSSNFMQANNCPATIAPEAGCEIIFVYTAPAESKWENATVTIPTKGLPLLMADGKPVLGGGNSFDLKAHSVPGGVITLNSQKHVFAEVAVGTTSAAPFGLLVSNGTEMAVPFSFKTTGDTAAYTVTSNCPASIAPSGQCSLTFTFKPTAKSEQQLEVTLDTGTVPVQGGNKVTLLGKGY